MSEKYRYAVYYVPSPQTLVSQLASALLGWDSEHGRPLPHPVLEGIEPGRLSEITAEARKYGLHATLKPPFYLKHGCKEQDVIERAEGFAASQKRFSIAGLRVKRISTFVALVPKGEAEEKERDEARLGHLAEAALLWFEDLRRPPLPEETARRKLDSLNPRQRRYLAHWGYPYVLEDYRFHLTLTGRMQCDREVDRIRDMFSSYLEKRLETPVEIDAVCICRQRINETQAMPFTVLRRYSLPEEEAVSRAV